jgi:hypothetical protein
MANRALASPTKMFFIDMLTRDIKLEDAILDLIDNSIDSYIRRKGLRADASLLLSSEHKPTGIPAKISISISDTRFSIEDTCGGIDRQKAEKEVFRFGKTSSSSSKERGTLSVYGIGLKRAVFKIGRDIEIESKTMTSGFRVNIDADEWLENDNEDLKAWYFPLRGLDPADSQESAGTKVVVKRFNREVGMRLSDGTFFNSLKRAIGETYSLFLGRFVEIELNGQSIPPIQIPVGSSEEISLAYDEFESEKNTIQILAGLSAQPWESKKSGWYVLCNGRLVVSADKTELTGWGSKMGTHQPKYRGFVGVVFFFSQDPEELPWTTTKRGLNNESVAYQVALNRMPIQARPILRFLDSMYASSKVLESQHERKVALESRQIDFISVPKDKSVFKAPPPPEVQPSMVSIQFKFDAQKIEDIKRTLRKTRWSARRLGEYALQYLYDQECDK